MYLLVIKAIYMINLGYGREILKWYLQKLFELYKIHDALFRKHHKHIIIVGEKHYVDVNTHAQFQFI